jgi:hypothetical protein
MREPELWSGYARHLASGTSLLRIVDCADMAISRFTEWRWRHRLLGPLAVAKQERLGVVVEADETLFLGVSRGVGVGSAVRRQRIACPDIAVLARSCRVCRISTSRS